MKIAMLMFGSRLSIQVCVIVSRVMIAVHNRASSMKPQRGLERTRKTAGHLSRWTRETWRNREVSSPGPAKFAGGLDSRESDALDPLQVAAGNLTDNRLPRQDLIL